MLKFHEIRSKLIAPLFLLIGLLPLAGKLPAQGLPEGDPQELGFSPARLERVDELITSAIEDEVIAGAVALIARHGQVALLESYGMADADDAEPAPGHVGSPARALTAAAASALPPRRPVSYTHLTLPTNREV